MIMPLCKESAVAPNALYTPDDRLHERENSQTCVLSSQKFIIAATGLRKGEQVMFNGCGSRASAGGFVLAAP
jgi:hypothetical protein